MAQPVEVNKRGLDGRNAADHLPDAALHDLFLRQQVAFLETAAVTDMQTRTAFRGGIYDAVGGIKIDRARHDAA